MKNILFMNEFLSFFLKSPFINVPHSCRVFMAGVCNGWVADCPCKWGNPKIAHWTSFYYVNVNDIKRTATQLNKYGTRDGVRVEYGLNMVIFKFDLNSKNPNLNLTQIRRLYSFYLSYLHLIRIRIIHIWPDWLK